MNEHTGTGRGRPRRAGAAALAALAAGIALAAACGGGSPAAAAPTGYQAAVAYAQCMRAHGEPGFRDPDSQGRFANLSPASIHAPVYLSATKTCGHLLPNYSVTPEQRKQDLSRALRFSVCMRAHGILDYPDPTERGGNLEAGGPPGPGSSPQLQAAGRACRRFQPPGLP